VVKWLLLLLLAACRGDFDARNDAPRAPDAAPDVIDAAPFTATWTEQPTGTTQTLYDVWGSSATDIYVIGDGTILHSAGDGTWTMQAAPQIGIYAVWGTSASDVYIGGNI
jgi:hypothetical protein